LGKKRGRENVVWKKMNGRNAEGNGNGMNQKKVRGSKKKNL
jgi:hypothetical protein